MELFPSASELYVCSHLTDLHSEIEHRGDDAVGHQEPVQHVAGERLSEDQLCRTDGSEWRKMSGQRTV